MDKLASVAKPMRMLIRKNTIFKSIKRSYSKWKIAHESYRKKNITYIIKVLKNRHPNINNRQDLDVLLPLWINLLTVSKIIMNILQVQFKNRSKLIIGYIKRTFENFTFFQDMKEELPEKNYMQLFQYVEFLQIERYQPVFLYGSVGKKFLIIISGEVLVLVPDDYQIRSSDDSDKSSQEEEEILPESHIKALSMYPGLKVVRTLMPGDSFGEIALREHVKRTATIFTTEQTKFMMLSKKNYNLILSSYQIISLVILIEKYDQQKQQQRIMIFTKFDILKELTMTQIGKIEMWFTEYKYKFNEKIYQQGDLAEFLYFIKEGQIEVILISFSLFIIPLQLSMNINMESYEKEQQLKEKQVNQNHRKQKDPLIMMKKFYNPKAFSRVCIAVLDKWCLFGENEIEFEDIHAKHHRRLQARVVSPFVKLQVIRKTLNMKKKLRNSLITQRVNLSYQQFKSQKRQKLLIQLKLEKSIKIRRKREREQQELKQLHQPAQIALSQFQNLQTIVKTRNSNLLDKIKKFSQKQKVHQNKMFSSKFSLKYKKKLQQRQNMFHSLTQIAQVGQCLEQIQQKQQNSLYGKEKIEVFFNEYSGPKRYDHSKEGSVKNRRLYKTANASPNRSMYSSFNQSFTNNDKTNLSKIGEKIHEQCPKLIRKYFDSMQLDKILLKQSANLNNNIVKQTKKISVKKKYYFTNRKSPFKQIQKKNRMENTSQQFYSSKQMYDFETVKKGRGFMENSTLGKVYINSYRKKGVSSLNVSTSMKKNYQQTTQESFIPQYHKKEKLFPASRRSFYHQGGKSMRQPRDMTGYQTKISAF